MATGTIVDPNIFNDDIPMFEEYDYDDFFEDVNRLTDNFLSCSYFSGFVFDPLQVDQFLMDLVPSCFRRVDISYLNVPDPCRKQVLDYMVWNLPGVQRDFLERYDLEQDHDWESSVYGDVQSCRKCGNNDYLNNDKFCQWC